MMIMKARVVAAILIGLTTVSFLIRAATAMELYVALINPRDQARAQELSSFFGEINRELMVKLPNNSDPEANIEAAEELLDSISIGRLGCFKGRSKKRKEALEVIVALKKTVGECIHASFDTIAWNWHANRALEGTFRTGENGKSRTRLIFEHYHQKHADYCKDFYKLMATMM